MTAIHVRSVTKRYHRSVTGRPRTLRSLMERIPRTETWALRDVSFEVQRGETIAVMGRNGSGKSTLLRVLGGVTRPTSGDVEMHGQIGALLTLGEAFHPELSGEENALTGAVLAGLTRVEARRRLPDIAAFAELEDRMDQSLRTYSDGQRLRLAFSVAIHIDPDILLIDELLAVGDLGFQERCLSYLEGLQEAGVTIVVASHDLTQIRRLAARTLWLERGEVRGVDATDRIADEYEEWVRYGGTRPQVLPDGAVRHGTKRIEITDVRVVDHAGRRLEEVEAGRPLIVEIDFRSNERAEDAIFVVSAHAEGAGTPSLDLNTIDSGSYLGPLAESGTVALSLDRVDLVGGRYFIDVGVYRSDWSEPYDYIWKARRLEVSGDGPHASSIPPHRWSLR